MIPRKSVTPSSNRTTPDQHRKSFNSAVSISSSASMTSLRTAFSGPRAQQNTSGSRLPTLKPRSETAMAGAVGGVPPVPAIPKAYESPKGEPEAPFFSQRMPSFSQDVDSTTSASTADQESIPSNKSSEKDRHRTEQEARSRTGIIQDRSTQADDQRASGAQNGRRTLQPIRLPPLNLPSTKGSPRQVSDAWPAPPAPKSPEIHTPPPRRGPPKTPSTPMTAS